MKNDKEIAVFGGGCFWCTEAVFKMLKGVKSVLPGYAGGESINPTYASVSSGNADHAEVIKIDFDPRVIDFKTLLTVFFATHDGSQLNRQGNDTGTQYRSIVLYTTENQKTETENFIREINNSNPEGKPLITEIVPLLKFFEAEDYHKDYFARNPDQAYCQLVINPKLEKVQEIFANLINK